jgi:WD40 repeat protein
LTLSRDGKVAATASADKTVRIWDVSSGILLRVLPIGDQAFDVGIFRDGKRAIVTAHDQAQIWDILHGKLLGKFKLGQSRVRLLHRSDSMVQSNGLGAVALWELSPPKLVRSLTAERRSIEDSVKDLDVSPDDSKVAIAREDGTIEFVELQSGKLLFKLSGQKRATNVIRFSHDGATLTSFGEDGSIRQWDTNRGKQLLSRSFGKALRGAALLGEGEAVVGGNDGGPKVIELGSGAFVRSLESSTVSPTVGIRMLAVTTDGRRTVSVDVHDRILFHDLRDGTLIHRTLETRPGAFTVSLTTNGDKAVVGFGGGEVDVWDVVQGSRVRRIPFVTDNRGGCPLGISPDGRSLFRAAERTIYQFDARSGELLRQMQSPKPYAIYTLVVSPNGKRIAIGGSGQLSVFDVETGSHLWSAVLEMSVNGMAFSLDSQQLVAGSENKDTRVYDARDGKEIRKLEGPRFGLESVDFLEQKGVLLGAIDTLGLWDLRNGRFIGQYTNPSGNGGIGAFSVDRKWVIGGDGVGLLTLFDAKVGKVQGQVQAHADRIRTVVPSTNGRLVFSSSFDNTVRITPFDALTRGEAQSDPRAMVWVADESDWLAYTADGYFDASRRGGRLVAAVQGFDGFRVDQLAARNNRPDIALERLGLGTPETLALYASRHQQRLKRLGLQETDLVRNLMTAPRATLVDLTRSGRKAHLRCNFAGNGRSLRRYFAFVNDVAVGDGEGVALSGANATVEFDIELSAGRNKIEVSALNDVGVESFRDVRTVNVNDTAKGNLYYLGFGVSKYVDPRLTLKFAHKDVLDLGLALEQTAGRGYDRVFSRILTDAQVTKSSIFAAREFLKQAKLDDTVVVFAAGHGVFGSGANEQYYFITHDTELSKLRETAAGFDLIEDLVTGIAPRKKLLLLDTCQSGEREGDVEEVQVTAGRSRGLVARGIRPLAVGFAQATKSRPRFVFYQDRFIFNDLSRRSGTIVFSASRGSELSYEDDRIENGVFTFEILQALSAVKADLDQNGSVSTDELREYVIKAVSTRTDGLQNPTVDRDNLEALFGFPLGQRRVSSLTRTQGLDGSDSAIPVASRSNASSAPAPNPDSSPIQQGSIRRMPGRRRATDGKP